MTARHKKMKLSPVTLAFTEDENKRIQTQINRWQKQEHEAVRFLAAEPRKTANLGERLMLDERTCDGVVLVGKERVPVKVHKAIMAGSSLFFEKAFFSCEPPAEPPKEHGPEWDGKHVESKGDSDEVPKGTDVAMQEDEKNIEESKEVVGKDGKKKGITEIELVELEPPEFKVLREFCYTGKLKLPSFDSGLAIYKIAEDFGVPSLKEETIVNIQNQLTANNTLDAFFACSAPTFRILREFIAAFVIEAAATIFARQNVLNKFSVPQVESLLKLELKVKEDVIMERVVEYAKCNLPAEMDKREKRKVLGPVLRLIDVSKIGANGMRLAKESGLFRKEKLMDAVLTSGLVAKYFTPADH